MFNKETIRLIKQTFKRFFALFMIVLIGTAFMMGLLSTQPIMESNIDRYEDEHNFQDLQIYSSYGFNEKDVEAVKKLDYIEDIFASRQFDCMGEKENVTSVFRLSEIDTNINTIELKAGRFPEADDEIVIVFDSVDNSAFQIGDEIRFYMEDQDIEDQLQNTEFKIVGIARTPDYMSKILGTSNYKNKNLTLVGYINNSNFLTEYYTTLLIRLNGTKDLNGFEKDYKELVSEDLGYFQIFANKQQEVYKTEILDKYKREIRNGERELAQKKEEGENQLAEAKKKLDDANIQLIASEGQLQSLKQVLTAAKARQEALVKQYSNNSYDEIRKVEKKYGKSFDAFYRELLRDYGTYNALKTMKDSDVTNISENIQRLKSQLASDKAELESQRNKLSSLEQKLLEDLTDEEREDVSSQISDTTIRIAELETQISLNEQLIDELEEVQKQIDSSDVQASMNEIDKRYDGSVEKTFRSMTELQEKKLIYDALQREIDIANTAIRTANREIRKVESQIASGKKQYEKGLGEYNKAVIDFNIQIEKAEADIKKAYQDLEELPEAEWIILDRDSHYSHYMFSENAKQMGGIGYGLPILFFMVAALVCVTTMSRHVDEQRGQIGIYRALGYSKLSINMKYVLYALIASVLGSVIGIVIGLFLFPSVIYEAWKLLYDMPDARLFFPPINIIICFVSFTVLMGGVTFIVCNKCLHEVPSQLLRPNAPKKAKKVLLERVTFIWNKLSLTGKITLRNIIRYKGRFFMTLIGIAGCTALLIVGFGVKNSVEEVVSLQFGEIFNHNYTVNLENDSHLEEIIEKLGNNLDNEYYAPYMTYYSKVVFNGKDDKSINAIVINAREGNDVFKLTDADSGKELGINNNGIIISEKFARDNSIAKGDSVIIESNNGIKREVRVNAVCRMYFQQYIFISEDYYDAIFEEPIHKNAIAVKNTTDPDFYKDIEDIEGYLSRVDYTNLTEQFNTMIKSLDLIIMVIIVTAASLAFVVLVNLTQVNISERLRELATLKVLGFRDHEVNSYIFKEMFLLSLMGAILGIPLGKLFHAFIMGLLNMDMIMFGMNIKPMSYIISVGITILFTVLVMLFTLRSLKKIKMVESLKSVE